MISPSGWLDGIENDVFAIPEPSVVTEGSQVSWNLVVTDKLPSALKLKLDSTRVALRFTVSPRFTSTGFPGCKPSSWVTPKTKIADETFDGK